MGLGEFLVFGEVEPGGGCFWKEFHANEAWVRVLGLPLHPWIHEVLKRI